MSEPATARPLAATEFVPLDARGHRSQSRLSYAWIGLGVLAVAGAAVLLYLFAARAVIFRIDPVDAELTVRGLSFHIGGNFLLLPGTHTVLAEAEGYRPLETEIEVGSERTQEIPLVLEALPGRLQISSTLQDIEVFIDDEPAGTAPGLIEDIARGPHRLGFAKHRYFPAEQEVVIEGLGRTQQLEVVLEPAWGAMEFSSTPSGAAVTVDGAAVGTTPLTTEVLETGSQVSVAMPGYKTWQRELTVKAGTTQAHPPIQLVVADGTLDVSTTPRGAAVSVNGEFRGSAPTSIELSPLREHRVDFFLEGYGKTSRTVRIEPEGRQSLAVNLAPIIGRIELVVEPGDAEVLVNGASQGRGSQTLALTAREHRLTVRKPGFAEQTMPITPRPDHQQSLNIRLLTVDQAYWATRPPEITSPTGGRLRLFRPSAQFTMGSPRREPGRRANEAERPVRLERPFYIGAHEVTNAEFRKFRGEHSSSAVQGNTLDMDAQPAVNLSWQQAALFCNWLSRREGLPLFYVEQAGAVVGFDVDAHGYRLPTEAEWAWVARFGADGEQRTFPWGDDSYPPAQVIENYADQSASAILSFTLSNYADGYPVSAPVGSFAAGPRGLFDLGGNVSEWVHDHFEIRAGRGEPELDPTGPTEGDRHVIRGASWMKASRSELRTSYRDAGSDAALDLGFRLARYVDKAGVEQ